MGKIKSVFLSHLSSSSVSGLPGLILSMSGQGSEHLNVVGPMGLRNYMEAMEIVVKRKVWLLNRYILMLFIITFVVA